MFLKVTFISSAVNYINPKYHVALTHHANDKRKFIWLSFQNWNRIQGLLWDENQTIWIKFHEWDWDRSETWFTTITMKCLSISPKNEEKHNLQWKYEIRDKDHWKMLRDG